MTLARCRRRKVAGRLGLAIGLSVLLALCLVGLAQPARAAATITVSSCDESDLDAAIAHVQTPHRVQTVGPVKRGMISSFTQGIEVTRRKTLVGVTGVLPMAKTSPTGSADHTVPQA